MNDNKSEVQELIEWLKHTVLNFNNMNEVHSIIDCLRRLEAMEKDVSNSVICQQCPARILTP